MKIYEKMKISIDETKYLATDNTYRYRPIMRTFYRHYEKLDYWLYKEDVYNEIKGNIGYEDYTIEECERDLDMLTSWKNLSKMQDTKNASSIEEFKNKKFRYQLTEYATVIERLTISLEEMEVKTASLEPKLFDRLRINIAELEQIDKYDLSETNELWLNLNDDFTKLNQNYQDFLKKFNEAKTEELLQSTIFLQFKTEIIKYLREFIKGYQKNIYYIKDSINHITNEKIKTLLNKLNDYQKNTPIFNEKFNYVQFKEINNGKLQSIFKWFIGTSSTPSEGENLLVATDNIIVKLTKYAASLVELRGNMTNRKEEYKHICRSFDKISTIEEAHKLSSVIIGIPEVRHFIGSSNLNTDIITNTYDIAPIEITLNSRTKRRTIKVEIKPIIDKTIQKQKLLEEYRKQSKQNKDILKSLIKDKKIVLENEIKLSKIERRYIEKLLSNQNNNYKETEFGLNYKVLKSNGKCKIKSSDGIFMMDSVVIEFVGDVE